MMNIKETTDPTLALRSMSDDLKTMITREQDGIFHLALSGGSTAQKMFTLWATEYHDSIFWQKVRFYWVDERCVPPDDNESNYGHAHAQLFKPLGIPSGHIFRIHGENDPETEAKLYAELIRKSLPLYNGRPRFDAIILGAGPDAHTASIFPHTRQLLTDERPYAVSQHPVSGQYRVTMTGTTILNASPLLVPMFGKDKSHIISDLKNNEYSCCDETPIAYIIRRAENATIYYAP